MNNKALAVQLTELLQSSQTLRTLLDPYVKGYSQLTFDIDNIASDNPDKMNAMVTDAETNTITINKRLVGENGFEYAFNGKDEVGYQHDDTIDGSFSAAIGHEALHARHFYWYKEAMKHGKTANEHAKYLEDQGFSNEFVKIFYDEGDSGWESRPWPEINYNEHSYFTKYESGVMDDVRSEYKSARAASEKRNEE